MWQNWRLQLGLILLCAVALRGLFFVGFGLGDDLGYIAHANEILAGRYPPLDPLNQYAYRPLLLVLFAGGIALFGHTDLGVVAPVLLASLTTTALIFVFVRRLIDPAAAWWCALLYAFEPFNVVNSTTMTNDVILSCLTFAAVGAFLLADGSSDARKSASLFAAAALLAVAAFLVKLTALAVVSVLIAYSLAALRRGPAAVIRRHGVFYATLLVGLFCVCLVYYFKKGDLLWQFKSEAVYYETYKPDWYLAGAIDYRALMRWYPQSLFGTSGYPGFLYRDHGFLFWLAAPAAVLVLVRSNARALKLLAALAFVVFAFFQFYPQYLSPRYLPLVRQERYLEMLLPAAVIVTGTTLCRLHRRRRVIAVAVLGFLLVDFVVEAHRRFTQYDDSQQDVRELARYVESTLSPNGARLVADRPARNALSFYVRQPAHIDGAAADQLLNVKQRYVAVGGARSFWWSRQEVFDLDPAAVPAHWILSYEVPGRHLPWRPTNLRVYYATEPKNWYPLFDMPQAPPAGPMITGLNQSAYPGGFDGKPTALGRVEEISDLDNRVRLPAPRLQWTAWLHADDAVYTFESNSDDGSWVHLNDKLLLDNGGTHPARTMRRTVRLARGWYGFRLRYEDTGGDRLLQLRVYKDHAPVHVPQATLFFLSQAAGPSTGDPGTQ